MPLLSCFWLGAVGRIIQTTSNVSLGIFRSDSHLSSNLSEVWIWRVLVGFVIRRVDGNPFLLLVVWFRIFESPFQCNLDKTVPSVYQPGLDYSQIESYVFLVSCCPFSFFTRKEYKGLQIVILSLQYLLTMNILLNLGWNYLDTVLWFRSCPSVSLSQKFLKF